jgi:phage shock protein A
MATADQRLDQLEPVISELLARQDETAAKVERVSAQLRQLTVVTTNALSTQSDNIGFLLNKVVALDERMEKVDQRLDKVDHRLDKVDQQLSGLNQQVEQLGQQFTQLADFLREKLK